MSEGLMDSLPLPKVPSPVVASNQMEPKENFSPSLELKLHSMTNSQVDEPPVLP